MVDSATKLGNVDSRSSLQIHNGVTALYCVKSIEEVCKYFNVSIYDGLSDESVALAQRRYGPNELKPIEKETLLYKFLEQFKSPLILLLLASSLVSLFIGQLDNAISIAAAIVIVSTVAFVQEYRSEKSLEALNQLVPHYCHVLRQSHYVHVLASDLVPGDIVRFRFGDRIPADVRIISAVGLEIDESTLTGENRPAKKQMNVIDVGHRDIPPLAERFNVAYMGTLVRSGHGTGVVIATGASTEFGAVFSLMRDTEERKTPLQMKMDQLGQHLSLISFAVIGCIMLTGLVQGRPFLELFTISVSLAVAAIPEGLPIVVTVTLALGVMRMAKQQVIVKKLPSVESLGSVDVICVDKTGTLTQNKMVASKVYVMSDDVVVNVNKDSSMPQMTAGLAMLLRCANLCNNAMFENGVESGNATECALLNLLVAFKLSDQRDGYDRLNEIPFSSESKWMAVLYRDKRDSPNDDPFFYVKGASESVLKRCTHYYKSPLEVEEFGDSQLMSAHQHAARFSSRGLRVLAFAYGLSLDALIFVGLVAMHDPPRRNVREAMSTLSKMGVNIIMITGDSKETATAIAEKLDILKSSSQSEVASGHEVEHWNSSDKDHFRNLSVVYRATPKHKLAIVRGLQESGCIVAMTGDGVNDAPALKLADIGISMGQSGTDVSKEAAKMILVDDNIFSLIHAIEEGKSIFHNIRHFLRFQLSTSLAALTLVSIATLCGFPNPLNAMQILWINIIMDGPPAQSLGVEPVDHDILREPPRARNAPILTRDLLIRAISSAIVIVFGTMYIFLHEMADGVVTTRDTTMTFTTFVMFDMFNALTCRSTSKSIFTIGVFSNHMLNAAIAFSIAGQLLVIYVPPLQRIFLTESLAFIDCIHILLLSSSVLWIDELRKWISRRNAHSNIPYVESYALV